MPALGRKFGVFIDFSCLKAVSDAGSGQEIWSDYRFFMPHATLRCRIRAGNLK